MIGRFVWFAVIIAAALGTAVLQIDKQSERSPALARLVPAPLRNFAQTEIAHRALAGEDAAAALAEAERLVQRRPLPSEYLTLLAGAQVKAGRAEQAAQTIQIAGQRGWRDPMAQHAVLRIALAAGDTSEAARRYAALFLRNTTPNSLLLELGPAVLGEPDGAGQQTMVAIVVGAERWHAQFLRRGPDVMPPEAFAAITAQSLERGVNFDCGRLAQSIGLLRARDADAAERLAASVSAKHCPRLAQAG
jgi:hypothetical protein